MGNLNSWESYDPDKNGPLSIVFRVLGGIVLIVVCLWGIGTCFGWFGEAATVTREQVGPRALLVKYEWFKDAKAALDAKRANISVYETRFKRLQADYEGQSRSKWPEDERQQANLWSSELAGIVASYNALAAEYNSNMAKVNWAFTNVGSLPQGATEVMPREVATYQTTY